MTLGSSGHMSNLQPEAHVIADCVGPRSQFLGVTRQPGAVGAELGCRGESVTRQVDHLTDLTRWERVEIERVSLAFGV